MAVRTPIWVLFWPRMTGSFCSLAFLLHRMKLNMKPIMMPYLRACRIIHHRRLEEAVSIWEDGYAKGENLVSHGKRAELINLGLGYRVGCYCFDGCTMS